MILRKTRYLIYFQYIGTKYSGVVAASPEQNVCGVLNYLEKAALGVRPLTPVKFVVSSRTDAGVHALCNTAHVDIETSGDVPPLSEKILVHVLNKHLKPEPIWHHFGGKVNGILSTPVFSHACHVTTETPADADSIFGYKQR